MNIIVTYIFATLLLTNISYKKDGKKNYFKYNLNIKEIDGYSGSETIISFKNIFISSENGLFEYDFKLLSKTEIAGSSMKTSSKEDSVSISFIPIREPVYYKFDFAGNLLAKDSIKNKRNDFIKIDQSDNKSDPLFHMISNMLEKNLSDTVIDNINFKTYKYPDVIKDSIGDMTVQLFFIADTSLKTPFNINNRYHLVSNKYTLAGFAFNMINFNRKLVALISGIRQLTEAEKKLCNGIHVRMNATNTNLTQ